MLAVTTPNVLTPTIIVENYLRISRRPTSLMGRANNVLTLNDLHHAPTRRTDQQT
jgi:hypothetical protein